MELKNILQAAIFAANSPMPISQLALLFEENERPSNTAIKEALIELQDTCEGTGIELRELGSGYQFQSRAEYAQWIRKLWEERPARYSRALLETLVLIAYRQPITRAEIEAVRGVAVSTNIIKTLLEREWVRSVGQREVPGRPSLYGTTKRFLDYFNLSGLNDLPGLDEVQSLELVEEKLAEQLDLGMDAEAGETTEALSTEPSEEPEADETIEMSDDDEESGESAELVEAVQENAADDEEENTEKLGDMCQEN